MKDLMKNVQFKPKSNIRHLEDKVITARLKSDKTCHYCSSLINGVATIETQRFALKTVYLIKVQLAANCNEVNLIPFLF